MINPSKATFIKSAANLSQMPNLDAPQVVLLGRSNVGKSSFINAICGVKSLAKSSSTPGKTRLINFFEVCFKCSSNLSNTSENSQNLAQNYKIIFVDLPGFGYAKVSKKERFSWEKILDNYIKNAKNIKLFIHLIDARHFALQSDENLKEYILQNLGTNQRFIVFYTKCDKLNQKEISALKRFDKSANLVSISENIVQARQIIIKNVFESVDL